MRIVAFSEFSSRMPGDILVTDDPAQAVYQHIAATDGLPGTWNSGEWCSALCVGR